MDNSYNFLKAQLLPAVSKAYFFTQYDKVNSDCATPAAVHAGLNVAFPTVPHTWCVPASPPSGVCPAPQPPPQLMCPQGTWPASLQCCGRVAESGTL